MGIMGVSEPGSDVVVTIPYRASSLERIGAFETVVKHFEEILPGIDIIPVDSPLDPFNRAAARNACVRAGERYDVIVICDADTLLQPKPLIEAIEGARLDGLVHNPFTIVEAWDRVSSRNFIRGVKRSPSVIFRCDWGVGSAYVTTANAWWSIGGQDERFAGWGYEDTAFSIVHRTLKEPMPRHVGVASQLWHQPSPRDGDPFHDAGVKHYQSYLDADGIVTAVRELVVDYS